ncbi:MAG: hypothetical protein NTY02_19095, partial [Acidobacteria bacterium]|nr:hypothetical protein [Acidobacteriota bacterium]
MKSRATPEREVGAMTIEKSAAAAHPGTITGRAWRRFAVATGLTFGLGAAWLVWRMPLQVSDSLLLMLDSLSAQSGWVFGWQHSDSGAFFRPLYLAQVKWLMDLSPADHTLSFKVLHVGLLLATAWLFV